MDYYESEENEFLQLEQSESSESILDNDHWDHNTIVMLLDAYIKNANKLKNPRIKKKNVWTDIGNAVGRSPNSCDRKFRNLKQTYIRLIKKRTTNSESEIKWPYFKVFEEIFGSSSEFQPKVCERNETIAKALFNLQTSADQPPASNSEELGPRKGARRKMIGFRKVTAEMRQRQKAVEDKLDKLINIVEESNEIQRERNRLFQQFLDKVSTDDRHLNS